MQEELVTHKTALLSREIGFNIPTVNYYISHDTSRPRGESLLDWNTYYTNKDRISAPTQSLLQKWLRENHNIEIIIKPWTGDIKGSKTYAADVTIMFTRTYIKLPRVDTYEKALEGGLLEALKLIKDEKNR